MTRNDFEIRSGQPFTIVEDRAEAGQDDSGLVIEGLAAVFDSPAEIGDIHNGGFVETIDKHAFDGLALNEIDVPLTIEHGEAPIILARVRNKSLKLLTDEKGLHSRARLLQCDADWIERIKSGLYSQMSFAFSVARDGEEIRTDADGITHRRITKIDRLFDVSIVARPAYDSTELCARSAARAAEWATERRKKEETAAIIARWV